MAVMVALSCSAEILLHENSVRIKQITKTSLRRSDIYLIGWTQYSLYWNEYFSQYKS